ncbi:response regulator [Devosia sp.]|uniref:response regulator n=1 Tax=Devosia sp. TaxID=1871048 RepID=UPI0032654278
MVDDNSYARAISTVSFNKIGISQVDEADSGAQAILALLSQDYDVMLMDWYMPEISGAGLMQVLRDPRFGPACTLPVILMTAYASRENITRARELGVNEILVKPFSAEQLGVALGKVLAPSGGFQAAATDEFFL